MFYLLFWFGGGQVGRNVDLKYHRNIYLHNDVVDGDVNELHKKPDEAHNGESYRCRHGNLLKLWEEDNPTHCQDNYYYYFNYARASTELWSHNVVVVSSQLEGLPFLSGLVHLFTSRMESFTNILLGSTNCMIWSISEVTLLVQGFWLKDGQWIAVKTQTPFQYFSHYTGITHGIIKTGLDL